MADEAFDGRTVLVVEDEEGIRALTQRILERLGCRVLTAGNADEARVLSASHYEIDVLLTDLGLPGAGGVKLGDEIRGLRPRVKVIYMSGSPDDMIHTHHGLPPDRAFLHKPFTREALTDMLRQVLAT